MTGKKRIDREKKIDREKRKIPIFPVNCGLFRETRHGPEEKMKVQTKTDRGPAKREMVKARVAIERDDDSWSGKWTVHRNERSSFGLVI